MKHKKELLVLHKSLKNLFQTNAKIQVLEKKFKELDLTAKIIFRKEEKYYQGYDHPDIENHTKFHDEFSKTLASFQLQYFTIKKDQTARNVSNIMEYIEIWIGHHHNTLDESMQSYIRIKEFIDGK